MLEVPEGHLLLQTLRSHDQFNTTIYGHDDRYRGLAGGRHVVMVHPDDLARLGCEPDQVVDVVSDVDRRLGAGRPRLPRRLLPDLTGCAAAYYPECNVLVPLDSVADGSNCPTSKSVVVRFEPPGAITSHDAHGGMKAGSDHTRRSGVEPTHLS